MLHMVSDPIVRWDWGSSEEILPCKFIWPCEGVWPWNVISLGNWTKSDNSLKRLNKINRKFFSIHLRSPLEKQSFTSFELATSYRIFASVLCWFWSPKEVLRSAHVNISQFKLYENIYGIYSIQYICINQHTVHGHNSRMTSMQSSNDKGLTFTAGPFIRQGNFIHVSWFVSG